MDVFLTVAIILAIGVAILVGFSLERTLRQKKNNSISMHYQKSPLEYIDPWKQEKEVVSSEKIKLMKEKELEKKAKEEEIKGKKKEQEKENYKEQEGNKRSEVLRQLEDVRAGEVQRNGQEQFNLRKDEPSNMNSDEDGKWWL